MDNVKPTEPTEPTEATEPTEPTEPTDISIENQALKELLEENKNVINEMKKELTEVKRTNAKLLLKMDNSNVNANDSLSMFSRYSK